MDKKFIQWVIITIASFTPLLLWAYKMIPVGYMLIAYLTELMLYRYLDYTDEKKKGIVLGMIFIQAILFSLPLSAIIFIEFWVFFVLVMVELEEG